MNNTIEQWRTISEYSNYQVSNMGRVMNIKSFKILKCMLSKEGYHRVGIYNSEGYKQFSVHRLVAREFIENTTNKPFVDHIDHNRMNNNITNLRWVSNQENIMNNQKVKGTTSIYKGVGWNKNRNCWKSAIMHNYKTIHLGVFDNQKDAARAYNKKAIELFGEYAYVNEISDDEQDED